MREMKAGSMVEYLDVLSNEIKKGKICMIATIEDSLNKNDIGETTCFIEYDPRCYTDRVNIKDLKLVD